MLKKKKIFRKVISKNRFVIQKHEASHLHYDFRLEMNGKLKSWAIPKGPSISSLKKRLCILVEDHPLEYRNFEGIIEKGYGAGIVMLWDKGKYKNLLDTSIESCFRDGKIEFFLYGERIKGKYSLIRYRGDNWLLIKMKDDFESSTKSEPIKIFTTSIKSNKTFEEIKK